MRRRCQRQPANHSQPAAASRELAQPQPEHRAAATSGSSRRANSCRGSLLLGLALMAALGSRFARRRQPPARNLRAAPAAALISAGPPAAAILRGLQPQRRPRAASRAASSQPVAASIAVPCRTRRARRHSPRALRLPRPEPLSPSMPCIAPSLRRPRPRHALESVCRARPRPHLHAKPVRSLSSPGRSSQPDLSQRAGARG